MTGRGRGRTSGRGRAQDQAPERRPGGLVEDAGETSTANGGRGRSRGAAPGATVPEEQVAPRPGGLAVQTKPPPAEQAASSADTRSRPRLPSESPYGGDMDEPSAGAQV